MECGHCLRGPAQYKDITFNVMDKLLEEVESIGVVIFTGGEPSLNVKGLKDFLEICKRNKISITSFYIATNGTNSDDFIDIIFDLYNYCLDKKSSHVDISRSSFHIGQDEDVVAKLKTLPFVYEREEFMLEDDYIRIRKQGRAEDPAFEVGEDIKPQTQTLWNGVLRGIVYLNVNGDICNSCDLSYANQEINKIGNITEETLSEMLT